MIQSQNNRYVQMLPPISVSGGATATTTNVDTQNAGQAFDWADVIVQSGLVGANGVATIKLQECDTSGGTFVDITGAAFTALVDADDNEVFACHIDLRIRKRYLKLVLINGATNASVMACLCILSRAHQEPSTATLRGLTQELSV